MAWAKDSRRRDELPADWEKRRAECKRRAGGRCEYVGPSGARCIRPGTDADHKSSRFDHDDLQWLCAEHHGRKTAREGFIGKYKLRRKGERKRKDDRPGAL